MDAKRKQARQWLLDSPLSLYHKIIKEAKLTPRQQRIAFLRFRRDLRSYQIAQQLNICPETIRDEMANIYDKIKLLII
jgi:DNA-binding NarL/FixJ family response regulator